VGSISSIVFWRRSLRYLLQTFIPQSLRVIKLYNAGASSRRDRDDSPFASVI
jgi:hypothetical protein